MVDQRRDVIATSLSGGGRFDSISSDARKSFLFILAQVYWASSAVIGPLS